MLILKALKVLCFHTLLQVLILKVVNLDRWTAFRLRHRILDVGTLVGAQRWRMKPHPRKKPQGYEDSALRYTDLPYRERRESCAFAILKLSSGAKAHWVTFLRGG